MNDKSQSQTSEQMPQTIGRYQVSGSIGYGAMGAVYKAFDPLIKRTLAIKTIRLDIPRQSPQYKSFIERFYHEARISGTLSHPNIVTLFDIGEENGIPYLAMEFVEGQTIASLLEKGVRFPPEKVIGLISQIASALDYAHSKGVIHRDIKPSNLILSEGDRVKVTDFGIAKLVDAEMTQSGTLLGTPSYMSPEQAMGDKLDGRSDIFSLGVCAFEMLSGEQPFPGTNVTSILYKLVHVEPIQPADLELNGLVPQKWHEVFGRVLAKKPDDRYQNATEFVQDLEYCLGSWFGSAMGDEAGEGTQILPALDGASGESTRSLPAMPAVPPPPPRPVTPPAPPPTPPPPPPNRAKPAPPLTASQEAAMPTIQVRAAPAGEEEVGKTVVMKAGDSAPPAGGKPTPQPTTNAEATIVMSAPAAATAPRPAPEATMRASAPAMTMKSAAPPVTIRTTTPTSKVPAAEPTVRTPAPAKPPAAPAPPVTVTAPTPIPPASVPVATGARRQGISPALLLALAAMVFLAALVGAGLFIWSRQAGTTEAPPATTLEAAPVTMGTLPPAAPPPSLAAQGTLHVETQPPGATVSVAGEVKGQTPLDLSLALGIHEIRLELKGYDARTQNVALTAETPQADVKVTLARAGPAMGTADFLSTPFGAAVSVDGSHVGQTPLTGYKLKPGLHQVDVSKDGYEPYSTTIKVEAGKPPARVDTALTALPQPTATPLPVETVDPNRVYLNSPSEVDTVARRLGGVSPAYPAAAPRLRSGESVSVSGTFVVTDAGDVTDVKVVESGGKQVDDAVIAAVRDWKFSPALKKGVKVKVRVTFKQTFRAG